MRVTTGARRLALLAAACAVAVATLGCHSASASLPLEQTGRTSAADRAPVKKVTVDPRMFGVHDAHLTSLSHSSTRAIRLWDTGTTWPEVQPAADTWSFDRLDQVVSAAWADHTEVTFVAALTPEWALAQPVDPASTHAANTYPPTVSAYSAFLAEVMARYKNYRGSGRPGIANYQVWNEANITTFWSGTPAQMAQLTKTAYSVRNHTDKSVKIIGPAAVTRLAYQQSWIKKFYALRVAGKPVWSYVDALSFNLYPTDMHGSRAATPEDSMALLKQVRAILAKDKVRSSVPIWNTEVNYGMRTGSMGGHAAAPISDELQVAYVLRTFLLNAAQGIHRVDWYAYDMGNVSAEMGGAPLGNTLLTDPDDLAAGTVTPAGKAFTRVQAWLAHGTLVGTRTKRPCIADRHGTYTCTIAYPKGMARVYWNPYGHGTVKLAASATRKVDQYGTASKAKGGAKLRVGFSPVLVKSRH